MFNIEKFNDWLRGKGLPTIAVVNPKNLDGQKVNARFMSKEVFENLVRNIKRDGKLESAPLVYQDGERYKIISGHHRVKAAVEAGLKEIIVLVAQPKNRDEVVYKQLSHNGLTGVDDLEILKKLYHSITDAELRTDTGVLKELENFIQGFAPEPPPTVGPIKTVRYTIFDVDAKNLKNVIEKIHLFEEQIEEYVSQNYEWEDEVEEFVLSEGIFKIFNKVKAKYKKKFAIKKDADAFVKMIVLADMKITEIIENHNPDKELRKIMLNEFTGKQEIFGSAGEI